VSELQREQKAIRFQPMTDFSVMPFKTAYSLSLSVTFKIIQHIPKKIKSFLEIILDL